MGKEIMEITERGDIFTRLLCGPTTRPYQIEYSFFNESEPILVSEKGCVYPICCICRPKRRLYLCSTGGKFLIGSSTDNCDCLTYTFTIRDESQQELYKVSAEYCQRGLCCGNCCGLPTCAVVIFKVFDIKTN